MDRTDSDWLVRDPAGGMPRLLEIMARLRAPDGCPWDRAQDFASIAPYTIEEAYEVADAIAQGDMQALAGELGDLLLQVVYHAQLAQEAGHFGFSDVVARISDKMFARHPHVFGDAVVASAADQTRAWETVKAAERGDAGVLDGIALALPALTRAVKLQARAARVGFDWPQAADVADKIAEEAAELAAACDGGRAEEVAGEFGDLLFAVVNLGRHLGLDPEAALRGTNAKFTRRFGYIEAELARQGRRPADSTLEEMETLWQAAKAAERG
jgi:ATP diphosphatase